MKSLTQIKSQFHEHSNASGTCYIGAIIMDYDELVLLFGEPHYLNGDKTLAEWCIKYADGTIATIYDWKNYGLQKEQIKHWHVGGFDRKALDNVMQSILDYHLLVINSPLTKK